MMILIFKKSARKLYWTAFIPYGSDFKNAVEAGSFAISAAQTTVTSIKPYAELIGFKKGGSSFIEKSAELFSQLIKLDCLGI